MKFAFPVIALVGLAAGVAWKLGSAPETDTPDTPDGSESNEKTAPVKAAQVNPVPSATARRLQRPARSAPSATPAAALELTPEQQRAAAAKAEFEQAVASGDPAALESQAFLTAHAAQPGVTTTSSGLQYEQLTEATGEAPKAQDTVKVHYHGTLPDGTVFDSSVQRGDPLSFPLNAVIPGWTEGLQLMPVGSKWRLTIPPYLAYGSAGAGSQIKPHAALIFEVELLQFEQDVPELPAEKKNCSSPPMRRHGRRLTPEETGAI